MLLVVFGGDPARLEGGERGESGGTLPNAELTVGWGHNSNFPAFGLHFCNFVLESVGETLVHGGATGEDHVLAQLPLYIYIGGLDGGDADLL